MKGRLGVHSITSVIFVAALFCVPSASAQDDSEASPGINSGGYNIHQSIEFGYRASEINGNKDTYDTFENLGSGVRLFDFTLEMRSIDHNGLLFDNLTFSNFGYGGDPNDVTRLRIEKNKWYDFRMMFRRDKNFWDYNLYANPLNPAALNPPGSLDHGLLRGSTHRSFPAGGAFVLFQSGGRANQFPARPGSGAPHAGLRRHAAATIEDPLPAGLFAQPRRRSQACSPPMAEPYRLSIENYSYTTNAYRAGVDFRVLPRTTISFDEYLSYYRQDNVISR